MTDDRANLKRAALAHQHRMVFVGMNFIECLECGLHAHQAEGLGGKGLLILHNADYSLYVHIQPEQFNIEGLAIAELKHRLYPGGQARAE